MQLRNLAAGLAVLMLHDENMMSLHY